MRELTPLCELARKHRTDKGGRHLTYGNHTTELCHEYTPVYYDLLHLIREKVEAVLEIGVNQGCSLRMWKEFFPNAQIVGLDIDRSHLFQEERIHCACVDQSNPDSLRTFADLVAEPIFDVIVDDGSHIPEHQITSMKGLLRLLKPGGLYFIEDIVVPLHKIGDHVPKGFAWHSYHCPRTIGRLAENEQLMVIRHV